MLKAVTLLLFAALAAPAGAQTVWHINNLTNIGGHAVTVFGQPQIVRTPHGDAIQFNGITDGLMVTNNPLGGLSNFTVELVFKPAPLTTPTAREPRIFHIQTPGPAATAQRFTLETRVATNFTPHRFHLDSHVRFTNAPGGQLTLFNENFLHPVGGWTHMAVTYDGSNFCNYLNGRRERVGVLNRLAFTNTGAAWIGQRANNVHYFEGEVLALRFSPRALGTNEFRMEPAAYATDAGRPPH